MTAPSGRVPAERRGGAAGVHQAGAAEGRAQDRCRAGAAQTGCKAELGRRPQLYSQVPRTFMCENIKGQKLDPHNCPRCAVSPYDKKST